MLYAHLKHNGGPATPGSVAHYSDETLSREYEELQQLLAQYPKGSEQQLQLLENYRTTYWYYYYNNQ